MFSVKQIDVQSAQLDKTEYHVSMSRDIDRPVLSTIKWSDGVQKFISHVCHVISSNMDIFHIAPGIKALIWLTLYNTWH
jgi:hypothetical protein